MSFIPPRTHEFETERLAALQTLNLLDHPEEERFDRYTRLAKALCEVPIASVSLIDANRQWFLSCSGLDTRQTSREVSIAARTKSANSGCGAKGLDFSSG